ncbi:MAG: OB-fold nucleic acid binding domain-containing protein [Candidatus Anstonellales archaeon]
MAKISELKAGIGNVDVEGKIIKLEEPREVVTKFGKKLRVANAILQDESGEIALSLWGDDIDKVKEGSTIRIEQGWVSEFKGTPQLSCGRFGKLTVI